MYTQISPPPPRAGAYEGQWHAGPRSLLAQNAIHGRLGNVPLAALAFFFFGRGSSFL
jgi:hypothetical protein